MLNINLNTYMKLYLESFPLKKKKKEGMRLLIATYYFPSRPK